MSKTIVLGRNKLIITYSVDKECNSKGLSLLYEKTYKQNKENYLIRRWYGIASQRVGAINRLSTHKRKQVLKEV